MADETATASLAVTVYFCVEFPVLVTVMKLVFVIPISGDSFKLSFPGDTDVVNKIASAMLIMPLPWRATESRKVLKGTVAGMAEF